MMTNDNDIASKFKVTVRILFVFGRIIVLIICIRPNTKDRLFGTALQGPLFLESHGWKVMEFSKTIFQAWKVVENSQGHGKSWKMKQKLQDLKSS